MTDAERQKRRYARKKAGLVRLEVWVPKSKFERIAKAIDRMLSEDAGTNDTP